MKLQFSLIIPVYNRPNEIDELLNSLVEQTYIGNFEVIIVEDGSINSSENIVKEYSKKLNLKYFFKTNSGAGLSRNFGIQKASGNYFIIFDSDCIIPPDYLAEVEKALNVNFTDAYGGADAAHESFTIIQKAINYSMTSFFTTGGIRGSKKALGKFQPRSFNLGISKKAFEVTKGFSEMKIGEDIDLTFRLWEHNFETQFVENAFVYHKRRATFWQFFKQAFAFGQGRPFLNKKYPKTKRITYWFPTLFICFTILSLVFGVFLSWVFYLPMLFYFTIIFIDSFVKSKIIMVAITSVITTIIQFFGYGLGFVKGFMKY